MTPIGLFLSYMWQRGIVKGYTVCTPLSSRNSFSLSSSVLRQREDSSLTPPTPKLPSLCIFRTVPTNALQRGRAVYMGLYLLRLLFNQSPDLPFPRIQAKYFSVGETYSRASYLLFREFATIKRLAKLRTLNYRL